MVRFQENTLKGSSPGKGTRGGGEAPKSESMWPV